MERFQPFRNSRRSSTDSLFVAMTTEGVAPSPDGVTACEQPVGLDARPFIRTSGARGMTKWIDQSALDAAINRRRYSAFSPLHVAPLDPITRSERVGRARVSLSYFH